MTKIVNKFIVAIITLIIISAAFSMLTNNIERYADGFLEMFEELPFYKPFAQLLVQFLKFEREIKPYSFYEFVQDCVKLFLMAFIRPFAVSRFCRVFLRIPQNLSIYEQEEYMEGITYKLKSMVLNFFITPIAAIFVSLITNDILNYLKYCCGEVGFYVIAVLIIIATFLLSLIPLTAHIKILTAVLWRLFMTFAGELLNTLVVMLCSLFLISSIENGNAELLFATITGYIIWIVIFEFVFGLIRTSVASTNIDVKKRV